MPTPRLPPSRNLDTPGANADSTSPTQRRQRASGRSSIERQLARADWQVAKASEKGHRANADGETGSPARSAAWHSKWEAMEADLTEATDDNDLSAPCFSLPEELEAGVSPPPSAGIPQCSASARDVFDSRDLAQLRGNAPRRRPGASPKSFQPAARRLPVGEKADEAASRSASASSSDLRDASSEQDSPSSPSNAIPFGAFSRPSSEFPAPLPTVDDAARRLDETDFFRPTAGSKAAEAIPKRTDLQGDLQVGCQVRVTGLVAQEKLNGLTGTIEEWARRRKRWRVRCDSHPEPLFVRTENLSILTDMPPPSMAVDTPEVPDPPSTTANPTAAAAAAASSADSPAIKSTTSPRALDNVDEISTRSPPSLPTGVDGDSPPQDVNAGSLEGVVADVPEVLPDTAEAVDIQGLAEDRGQLRCVEEPDVATVLSCGCDTDLGLRDAANGQEDGEIELDTPKAVAFKLPPGILPPPPLKAIQCLWRLWSTLVVLSLVEFVLLVAAALLDRQWSPCREHLKTCSSLHPDDCSGISCRDGAPFWAPAWPLMSLVFMVLPLRLMLRSIATAGAAFQPRWLSIVLIIALATVGLGSAALIDISIAGVHYALRCPMERSAGRCEPQSCPSPPCARKSEFSPCSCGVLEEAEMARALFLHGLAACHPYEWYPSQMDILEELLMRYETFACVFGPLECVALAAGGALLLVQLACCPLLFFASWGAKEALIMFFGADEQQHEASSEADAQTPSGNSTLIDDASPVATKAKVRSS